jgi:hypothetical protein
MPPLTRQKSRPSAKQSSTGSWQVGLAQRGRLEKPGVILDFVDHRRDSQVNVQPVADECHAFKQGLLVGASWGWLAEQNRKLAEGLAFKDGKLAEEQADREPATGSMAGRPVPKGGP